MGERDEPEQLELGLGLREPVPVACWAELIEHETEGDQDTGWWDA